ncbi:hypothetical protein ES707_03735 [subsurface metagenome]
MNSVQRVRIEYSKKGPIRYIGHLDLMHTFFRALKRANLPVSYTQGFNPRIKCSFSPALPLGFASEAEYIELYLDKKIDISSSTGNLQKELPQGLTVRDMEKLPLFGKSNNVKIKTVTYRINLQQFSGKSTVPGQASKEDIEGKIRNFLDKEEILLINKKGRRINVRSLILSIEMEKDWNIRLLLKVRGGFNFNPRIIIKTLLGVEKKDLAFVEFTREKFLF